MGPMDMQGIERMLGPSVWGKGGDEMKCLWDIKDTVCPMCKLKPWLLDTVQCNSFPLEKLVGRLFNQFH